MKREAFIFITNLIETGKPGMKISRVQIIKYMLDKYKPDIKDPSQHTCRKTGDSILTYYVRKGILKRTGRGLYEIITVPKVHITYLDVYKEIR